MKRIVCICFFFFFAVFKIHAQRKNILLDGKWSFSTDSAKIGIQDNWFIKGLPSSKESVAVPHTWNIKEKTARYCGWGWYERTIIIPADWKGSNVKLQFDAVYHDATIWVNNKKAGEHKSSGYTKFFVDITPLIIAGKENKIVVLADNSFSAENIPYKNSFDWPNDGGIIRSVSLNSTQKPAIDYIHILANPDLASPNLNGNGKTNIKIKLSEVGKIDVSKVTFAVAISELNQKTSKIIYNKKLRPEIKNGNAEFDINFSQINRWHFDDPNLYKLKLSVFYKNKLTDSDTAVFGFRTLKVSGDKLFFNGEAIRTAGVEWTGGASLVNGMAESKDEIRQNLEKLKYLNTMFTRFHFQQDDYVYDWCNKNGIMVQQEIPIWGHKTILTDTMERIAKFQLDEMINNAYNHPSIVAWGLGNEMDGRKEVNINGVVELYKYTKGLDTSRLINYVSNTLQSSRFWNPGILKDASSFGDVMMYNDYHSTWYRQARAGRGPVLDTIQVENRKMPLIISEFGLCEPENWGNDNKRIVEMINNYSVYESKSYIAGVIYFCLNDYRTHMGAGKFDYHTTRVHGVYDLNGNPKPSASILRELNCPIDVTGINRDKENNISITVVGGLGFPSYQLKDYNFYWSATPDDYRDGILFKLPLIKPGKTFDFTITNKFNNKGVITIEDSRGNVIYQKVIEEIAVYY